MTYLLSQSAKKYRSALPEGSVSLDLLLAFSGHKLPQNAMATIYYGILNGKVVFF